MEASPLIALTEGFQSALKAVAILAGIGVVLAFALLGRSRRPVQGYEDGMSDARLPKLSEAEGCT